MSRGFPTYEDLDIDEDSIEDYDENEGAPKKNWFQPAEVSLQQLDRVKPVATVYNIGLRDPGDLRPGRGKRTLVSTNDQLSDLQAEPPLSTVSYQKAAWGSETSIPEALKLAAQAGTRPTRPSSAKSGAVSKPLAPRKSRPQSAKDPLCPNGKIKTAALGIKGQKFDPSDGHGRNTLPPSGVSVGWAGPPAGLCDPSVDATIDSVQAVNAKHQKVAPAAPNCSPEPEDFNESFSDVPNDSPPPSPALHLSLSLPSADADAGDEPDTGRLIAKAEQFVKTQKKKESQKMKYFKADPGLGKIGETLQASMDALQEKQATIPDSSASEDQENESVSDSSSLLRMSRIEEETELNKSNNQSCDQKGFIGDGVRSSKSFLEDESKIGTSMHLDLASGENTIADKALPPSNGLEYLGPAKPERKNRSHPIFQSSDKKLSSHKHSHRPRPHSAKSDTSTDEDKPQCKGSKTTEDREKEVARPATAERKEEKSLNPPNIPGFRSGVHIREDRNITVDITPRNLGRKVPGKTSRKHRHQDDLCDLEVRNEWSGGGRRIGSEDCHNQKTPTHTSFGSHAATPVGVVYDDDSDNASDVEKKKTHKRRGPVKEKDLVTMVSNISLSDEEEDDPSKEMNIEDGNRTDDGYKEQERCSSSLSTGEKNYYNIARKTVKEKSFASLEEKENFITVTTKLILFDTEQPAESVVKTILEAPQSKTKERVTTTVTSDKPPPRPKLSGRPRSAKLNKSDLKSFTVAPPSPLPTRQDKDNDEGGFTSTTEDETPVDEERPLSRIGFVSMETNLDGEDEVDQNAVGQRPPSGKRRPLSAAGKTVNRPPTTPNRLSKPKAKESVTKRRPMSASAVDRSPSSADIHRANAAAQALRTERQVTAKASSSNSGSRFSQTQRHYASYNRSGTSRGQGRAKSASVLQKPLEIICKNPDLEIPDSEEMEKCKQIQNRLACYGIDVQPRTLEKALFPPTGRTLYYEVDATLPKSYSNGLLSHPRFWLPEEHRKLKVAEKKLALAELSLWRQKKEEERKARLAEGKKVAKKGKKKGKKKLRRSQSIC